MSVKLWTGDPRLDNGYYEDRRLRIEIEHMVRDGYSEYDIRSAVNYAIGNYGWTRFVNIVRAGARYLTGKRTPELTAGDLDGAAAQILVHPAHQPTAPARRAA